MQHITLPNQDKFNFQLTMIGETMAKGELIEKTEYRHGGVLESNTKSFSVDTEIEFIDADQSLGKHVLHVVGDFFESSFDTSCSQGANVHSIQSPTLILSQLTETERSKLFNEIGVSIYIHDCY